MLLRGLAITGSSTTTWEKYLENLDTDQLSISLLQGEVDCGARDCPSQKRCTQIY